MKQQTEGKHWAQHLGLRKCLIRVVVDDDHDDDGDDVTRCGVIGEIEG